MFIRENNVIETDSNVLSGLTKPFMNDSLFKYENFLRLVLPTNSALRSIAVQRENYTVPNGKPLAPSVEAALCRLFVAELDGYKKRLKEINKLYQLRDFTLLDGFCLMHSKSQGAITEESLRKFLKSSGSITRINDPELFIRRFDLDKDGVLTLDEFQKGFNVKPIRSKSTPKKVSIAKSKTVNLESKKLQFTPSLQKAKSEDVLAKLLEEQLRDYRELESIKAELVSEIDYNLVDVFKTIFDPASRGYVTFEEFYEALINFGVIPKASLAELVSLLKNQCSRVDKVVTFSNFCEVISPYNKDLAQTLYSRKSLCCSQAESFLFSGKTRMLLKLFFNFLCKLAASNKNNLHFFEELALFLTEGKQGQISVNNLMKFMTKYKIVATDDELIGLFEGYNKTRILRL